MISMDKKYRTRDGRNVEITHISKDSNPYYPIPYPVYGIVINTDGRSDSPTCWGVLGNHWRDNTPSPIDLIEIKED